MIDMTGELPTMGDAAAALRQGKVRSTDLTRSMLERIDLLDPYYKAYAAVMSKSAMQEAERADQEMACGLRRGPLHGVPIAVKDLLATRDAPTAAGMAILRNHYAAEDATVVVRLRQAGAVILGKLQMTEGAHAWHHPEINAPLNPWDPTRSSGYSSSGSGVAVAAQLCFGALGSDTGGSIRIPSAMNGVTGLKPTWGRVSRAGVFPLIELLDTIGPMTRSAQDAAALLSVIAGVDPKDPTLSPRPVPDYLSEIGRGISDLVLGVDWSALDAPCDASTVLAVRSAVEVFKYFGAQIRDVSLPPFDASALGPLLGASIAHAHRHHYPAHANNYGADLAATIEAGQKVTAGDVVSAQIIARTYRAQLESVYRVVDLVLVPVLKWPTPLLGEFERLLREDPVAALAQLQFTIPFNVSGNPTITLPAGFTDGMPVAVQIVGPHFSEGLLFRAGHVFQCATDWHLTKPPNRVCVTT